MQLPPIPPLTLGGAAGPSSAGLSESPNGVFNASGRSINFAGTQDVKGTQSPQTAGGGVPLNLLLILAAGAVVWMLLRR